MRAIKGFFRLIVVILVCAVVVVVFSWLFGKLYDLLFKEKVEDNAVDMTRYVLRPELCEVLYGHSPEYYEQYNYLMMEKFGDSQISFTVDGSGNLVLFLNNNQVYIWQMNAMSDIDKAESLGMEVASDFSSVTASDVIAYENWDELFYAIQACLDMQLINGNDPTTVDVYCIINDVYGNELERWSCFDAEDIAA